MHCAGGKPIHRINFQILTWAFVGLFLLVGLPLFFVSDPVTSRFLALAAVLCLGGFGIAMALDARQTGILNLQNTTIRRSARPWLFDALTIGIALCGVALVITAVVMLAGSQGPLQ